MTVVEAMQARRICLAHLLVSSCPADLATRYLVKGRRGSPGSRSPDGQRDRRSAGRGETEAPDASAGQRGHGTGHR